MKYLIYCRKSTDTEDKQVLSLESQENELQRIAEAQGLQVVVVLREAMSAKSVGRPVFNKMLNMIASGKADGILCWKLDRLARNMVDGGQVMDLLQKSVIKEIRTYESIHLPSDNVLMLAVHFGMANQYIRDLSANVKRGLRAKMERGEWPNRAPLGYVNDPVTKQIAADPERSYYIKRAFELYATGSYGIVALADQLYAEGFRTLTGRKVVKSNIQNILNRTFYTGVMERDGRFFEGKHIPLISKQLYDDVRTVMSGTTRPKSQHLFFSLRGFLKCASCGCALTASFKKNHQYYYCTNGRGQCLQHKNYLREDDVFVLVADLFDSLAFTDAKIELMYRAAKEKMESENGQSTQTLNYLQKLLKSLGEREARLLDTYLTDQIPKALYDQKVGEIQHERISLTRQIREAELGQPVFTLEPIKEVFLQGSRAKTEFLEANEAKKRTIVEKLLWNLSIENKKVAQTNYKSPYHILSKADKNAPLLTMLPRRVSTARSGSLWAEQMMIGISKFLGKRTPRASHAFVNASTLSDSEPFQRMILCWGIRKRSVMVATCRYFSSTTLSSPPSR
jgi:site-specific DNA recombinase